MKTRLGAAFLAGALALGLVAAETSPSTPNVGTAGTQLTAVEAAVTGLGDVPALDVLDISTYASNDTDENRNPLGGGSPFALADVVPLRVGDTPVGQVSARSDGDGQGSSSGGAFGDLASPASPLAVDVSPVTAAASASADSAFATVDAATARIEALLDGIGMDVDLTQLTSNVGQNGANAVQGLSVSGLDLTLGDLVALDILEQLPLSTILALLDQLPVDAPGDPGALAETLNELVSSINSSMTSFESTATTTVEKAELLDNALADLANLLTSGDVDLSECTESDLGDLTNLLGDDLGDNTVTDLLSGDTTEVTGGGGTLGDTGGTIDGTVDDTTGTIDDTTNTLLAVRTASVLDESLLDCATGDLTTLNTLDSTIDTLVSDIETLVGQLESLIGDLTAALEGLLAQGGALEDLLAQLSDLLPELAGTELLSVGAFDVGTNAVATDSVDTSRATFLCSAVDLSVLGEAFSTPSCTEGISAAAPVLAAVDDALGQVESLLATLPTADAVSIGDLTLEMFPDIVEQVSEDAGYVTAQASGTILNLEIPSITIDLSGLTNNLLGDLGLPDITGTLNDLLGDVDTALSDVSSALGAETLQTVDDLVATVDPTGGDLAALVDQVTDLLDGLDLGELGTLSGPISTPGLSLVVDPGSSASYSAAGAQPAPAPAPEPGQPSGAPAPEPLPATGGGLALLGLVTLGGAALLIRRRH